MFHERVFLRIQYHHCMLRLINYFELAHYLSSTFILSNKWIYVSVLRYVAIRSHSSCKSDTNYFIKKLLLYIQEHFAMIFIASVY